jgi:allantoin racemase
VQAGRKIAVLNPNSSAEVTRLMDEALAPLKFATRHEITCTELSGAPIGIETDAHVLEVVPMVVDFVEAAEAGAVVVACFSDPGVEEASRSGKHVIGIAEAAYCTALQLGDRFGVISLGPASIRRHATHIDRLGLSSRLAGDRAVGMSVAEGHSSPKAAAAIAAVAERLIAEDGADVLILGCAGLGARRAELERRFGRPVIDPVQAGVAAAITMLDLSYPGRR